MKEYKSFYGLSFIIYVSALFLTLGICFIPCLMILGADAYKMLPFIFAGCFLPLISAPFIAVINLIIHAIAPKTAYLDNETLTYESQTVRLNNVKYLSFYLGEYEHRSKEPHCLTVYTNDDEMILIKRPSFLLVSRLKRLCTNAKFSIDDLKSNLSFFITTVAVCLVLFTTFAIAGKLGIDLPL